MNSLVLKRRPKYEAGIFFSHTFEQVDGEELERELLPPSSMVWIDMEMTGLDFETEAIMELACVITDQDLNIVAETEDMILKVRPKGRPLKGRRRMYDVLDFQGLFLPQVDDEKLDNMVEWCQYHHGQSGLKEACRKSDLSVADAEEKVIDKPTLGYEATLAHVGM